MEYLYNAAQMKAADQYMIQQIGIPSMVLMERAALSVVEELDKVFGRDLKKTGKVLVVCGSGNNGGDGFAIARLLHEKQVDADILFVGKETSLTKETSIQKEICENIGVRFVRKVSWKEYNIIIDAVFGIGLSREIAGNYRTVIEEINVSGAWIMAVDIPSGVNADNGQIMGCAVMADMTVTFACKKTGQILYPGAEYCGRLIKKDIGIRVEGGEHVPFAYDDTDLKNIPKRKHHSNKGTFGKVLILAGSPGMCGASYLAAEAAYRTGSGLVRIVAPECNLRVLQTCIPEAIVSVWDPEQGTEKEMKSMLEWADAVLLGPGIGTGMAARKMTEMVLTHCRVPLVLDADALNIIAEDPHMLKKAECSVIITPHIGEMSRLTGKEKTVIIKQIISCAEDFAKQNQVICVLKDARTVVASIEKTYLNVSGNDGMACGGSGDALAGIITSLIGQGTKPEEAARTGVYLHGRAGDKAAEEIGKAGMKAGDLVRCIPLVLKAAET